MINKETIQAALKSPEGYKLIQEIIKDSGAKSTPVCFDDTNRQYYNLGRQSIGQELLKEMEKK